MASGPIYRIAQPDGSHPAPDVVVWTSPVRYRLFYISVSDISAHLAQYSSRLRDFKYVVARPGPGRLRVQRTNGTFVVAHTKGLARSSLSSWLNSAKSTQLDLP